MKTSTHLKKPFRTAKMSRALAEKSETISTHDADLLQTATQRLVAEFQPEQIWLFGSHAWKGGRGPIIYINVYFIGPLRPFELSAAT